MKTGGGEEFGKIDDMSLDIGRGTVAAIHVVPPTPIVGKLYSPTSGCTP